MNPGSTRAALRCGCILGERRCGGHDVICQWKNVKRVHNQNCVVIRFKSLKIGTPPWFPYDKQGAIGRVSGDLWFQIVIETLMMGAMSASNVGQQTVSKDSLNSPWAGLMTKSGGQPLEADGIVTQWHPDVDCFGVSMCTFNRNNCLKWIPSVLFNYSSIPCNHVAWLVSVSLDKGVA